MIRYLTTAARTHTIGDWLAGPGAVLADRIRPVFYEDALVRRPEIVRGDVWIVADYDKLSTDDALQASVLWQALTDQGCRLVNHPTRSMRRYELMRTLFEARINAFDIYRVVDLRPPVRYPVFLRRFDNHDGPGTALIPDADALAQEIDRVREDDWPMDWVAIVEYAETREPDGIHRMRSALKMGPSLVPLHVLSCGDWIVKDPDDCIWDAAAVAADANHLDRFPEREQVMEVFRLARIDFGRIDYSRAGDGIQVWEIDPSPPLRGPVARLPHRAVAAARVDAAIVAGFQALLAEERT